MKAADSRKSASNGGTGSPLSRADGPFSHSAAVRESGRTGGIGASGKGRGMPKCAPASASSNAVAGSSQKGAASGTEQGIPRLSSAARRGGMRAFMRTSTAISPGLHGVSSSAFLVRDRASSSVCEVPPSRFAIWSAIQAASFLPSGALNRCREAFVVRVGVSWPQAAGGREGWRRKAECRLRNDGLRRESPFPYSARRRSEPP